jgi:hypothetical protein
VRRSGGSSPPESLTLTATEATWLPPVGGSQLRDSAGISPDFARSGCPDDVRSTHTIAACADGGTGVDVAGGGCRYRHDMKRVLITLAALGVAAVLATIGLSTRRVTPPPAGDGSWEVSGQDPTT